MQVSGKFGRRIGWRPLQKILNPPLLIIFGFPFQFMIWTHRFQTGYFTHWQIQGGARDAPPGPFFQFYAVLGKIAKIISWRPTPLKLGPWSGKSCIRHWTGTLCIPIACTLMRHLVIFPSSNTRCHIYLCEIHK